MKAPKKLKMGMKITTVSLNTIRGFMFQENRDMFLVRHREFTVHAAQRLSIIRWKVENHGMDGAVTTE